MRLNWFPHLRRRPRIDLVREFAITLEGMTDAEIESAIRANIEEAWTDMPASQVDAIVGQLAAHAIDARDTPPPAE